MNIASELAKTALRIVVLWYEADDSSLVFVILRNKDQQPKTVRGFRASILNRRLRES